MIVVGALMTSVDDETGDRSIAVAEKGAMRAG